MEYLEHYLEPGRWWRIMRNGQMVMETSSRSEILEELQPGDVVQNLHVVNYQEWRDMPVESLKDKS